MESSWEDKEAELTTFQTQYDTLVLQYEEKEEALRHTDTRINDLSSDVNRLTSERMHYKTELDAARVQLERMQNEDLNYGNELTGGGNEILTNGTSNNDDEVIGFIPSNEEPNVIDQVQNDRLSIIEDRLERLALENVNLRQDIKSLEKNSFTSPSNGTGIPVVVTGGSSIEDSETSSNSTVTNPETGEAILDLSSTAVKDAPSDYHDEVLEEDRGEMSPQERAERAKSKIGTAIGSKIPKASLSEKDDLKKIEGIGPFIETKLNDVGIFTYEQLSMMDNEIVELITDAIQFFPGRIEKDDWKGQAATLMG